MGLATVLTATTRMACLHCGAIFRVDIGAAMGIGLVIGFLGLGALMAIVGADKLFAHPRHGKALGIPFAVAAFAARMFPSLELEDAPVTTPPSAAPPPP
jgi:hypothetical protein